MLIEVCRGAFSVEESRRRGAGEEAAARAKGERCALREKPAEMDSQIARGAVAVGMHLERGGGGLRGDGAAKRAPGRRGAPSRGS